MECVPQRKNGILQIVYGVFRATIRKKATKSAQRFVEDGILICGECQEFARL